MKLFLDIQAMYNFHKFMDELCANIVMHCGEKFYIHEIQSTGYSCTIEFEVCRYSEELRNFLKNSVSSVNVEISDSEHALYTIIFNLLS